MQDVHLLVAVHGMWGHPGHLAEVARIAREKFATKEESGVHFELLVAETNTESATYDGIDWGGERVADEVQAKVREIELTGARRVVRFSVVGYSMGGLLSRYLVGILHSRKFFSKIAPINFTTFATPHIGLPRYPSWLSGLAYKLGPKMLSRTGEQFYAVDKWSPSGKPLLQVMSEKDSIFIQALSLFQHLSIYGSAFNDVTVPYVTALIEEYDPFVENETNGMTFKLDEDYSPIITSYETPATPPERPLQSRFKSKDYVKHKFCPSNHSRRPFLPPFLQFSFPLNIVLYVTIPVLVPVILTVVATKLTVEAKGSRKRIRRLEKDEEKLSSSLRHMLHRLEKDIQDQVAEIVDKPGVNRHATTGVAGPLLNDSPIELEDGDEFAVQLRREVTITANQQVKAAPQEGSSSKNLQPVLLPVQSQMVQSLNSGLPKLKKFAACFPNMRNSHATIVCRDVTRFPSHRVGEGVLHHWIDRFEL